MIIQLKAKHFRNASYCSSEKGCPIERVLREILPEKHVVVNVWSAYANGDRYPIKSTTPIKRDEGYMLEDFLVDQRAATEKEPEEVVREIEIEGL